ncbi:DUF2635 domain-containing protein [Acidisoma sp. 7E03]
MTEKRIHVRPVGELRIPWPNGRVLPKGGAWVNRTRFVERRLAAGEIEEVPTPETQDAEAAAAALPATVDDQVEPSQESNG